MFYWDWNNILPSHKFRERLLPIATQTKWILLRFVSMRLAVDFPQSQENQVFPMILMPMVTIGQALGRDRSLWAGIKKLVSPLVEWSGRTGAKVMSKVAIAGSLLALSMRHEGISLHSGEFWGKLKTALRHWESG